MRRKIGLWALVAAMTVVAGCVPSRINTITARSDLMTAEQARSLIERQMGQKATREVDLEKFVPASGGRALLAIGCPRTRTFAVKDWHLMRVDLGPKRVGDMIFSRGSALMIQAQDGICDYAGGFSKQWTEDDVLDLAAAYRRLGMGAGRYFAVE